MKNKQGFTIRIAKIDAGYPGKPKLFEPLADKDNLKVWPEVFPGQPRPFKIVKGEKYYVHDSFKNNGELFEKNEADLKREKPEEEKQNGKVSSNKADS